MSKNAIYGLIALVVIIAIGVGAFVLLQNDEDPNESNTNQETSNSDNNSADTNTTQISKTELVSFTGKNGDKCYVAVDGTVYDATNADKWKNGVHTESNGLAKCGEDLSQVIKASPHGKSVLDDLDVVGELVD